MNALLLGLVLAQADAGFRWELPPSGFAATEATSEVEAGGVPTRLRTVWARGEAAQVGRFYVESFERQGLYVAPGQRYDTAVTGYDPVADRSYSVMLKQVKKGQVQVLLGEADLARHRTPEAAEVGPLFPGAAQVLVLHDEGVASVTYRAQASPSEVDAFYRQVLAGYREVRPGVFEGRFRFTVQHLPGGADGGTVVRLERRARSE
jgi:hypothetical protein